MAEPSPERKAEAIGLFTSITGAAPIAAEHYLDAMGWDIDRAANAYFENPSGVEGPGNDRASDDAAMDMSEEDARLAAALLNNDVLDASPPRSRSHPAVDLTGDTGLPAANRRARRPPVPSVQEPVSDIDDDQDEDAMLRTIAAHREAGQAAAQEAQRTMEAMMGMTRNMLGDDMPSMFPELMFGDAGPPGSFPSRGGSVNPNGGQGGRGGPRSRGGLSVTGRGIGTSARVAGLASNPVVLDVSDDEEDPDAALARRLMEEDERAIRVASAGPGPMSARMSMGDDEGDLDHLGVDKHELEEARMIEAAMMGIPYEPRLPTRGQGGPSSAAAAHDPAMFEERTLRWEQDQAYEESLAADKAKADAVARQAREAEEEARIEREEAEAAARAAEEEANKLTAVLQRKAASLPAEPEAGTAGVVTIMVRLPDGGRISRRFAINNSLQAVFDFIDVQQQVGTHKPGMYKLVNSYPRKVFLPDAGGTLEAAGITADTALFVEPA